MITLGCFFRRFHLFHHHHQLIIGIFIITTNHLATLQVYTLFLWMLRLKNPEQPSQLKHTFLQSSLCTQEVNRSPVYSIMLSRAPVSTNLKIDLLKEPRKYCDNLERLMLNLYKSKNIVFDQTTTTTSLYLYQMMRCKAPCKEYPKVCLQNRFLDDELFAQLTKGTRCCHHREPEDYLLSSFILNSSKRAMTGEFSPKIC